jgi:hypothetical protein
MVADTLEGVARFPEYTEAGKEPAAESLRKD